MKAKLLDLCWTSACWIASAVLVIGFAIYLLGLGITDRSFWRDLLVRYVPAIVAGVLLGTALQILTS